MNFPLTLWDLGLWLGLNGMIIFLTLFGMPLIDRTFMIKRNNLEKVGVIIIVAFALVSIFQYTIF